MLRATLLLICLASTSANAATVIHAGQLFDAQSGKVSLERSIVIDDERVTSIEDGYVDGD